MITGYYAKEAERGRCWSMSHIIVSGGKGLCGYKPAPKMKLQWCADGVELNLVECERCKEKFNKLK